MLLGLPPLKPVSNSQCRGVVSFATELRGCCAPHRPLAARLKAQGRKACPLKASAGQSSANPPGPCAARSVDDSDWCEVLSCEFLVIGSGIAGLSYALKVAEHGRVLMVSKETANEGSTAYAQGGISAVFGKDDSVESHILDTMRAGGYLNTYECALETSCFWAVRCLMSRASTTTRACTWHDQLRHLGFLWRSDTAARLWFHQPQNGKGHFLASPRQNSALD